MSQKKRYETEWSFSFTDLRDRIGKMVEDWNEEVEVTTSDFSDPLGDKTEATVKLALPLGKSTVTALENDENLIEATVTHPVGEVITFTPATPPENIVELESKSENAVNNLRGKREHAVGLTPHIPLTIDARTGAGQTLFDLSRLQLERVDFRIGAGETQIDLPTADDAYNVQVKCGAGETRINIAQNTAVNVSVKGGVGSVVLSVPANAALRVKAQIGMGGLDIPKALERLSGQRVMFTEKGVWVSEGFEDAAHPITVIFKGGVGNFEIKETETTIV
jgi:tRNA-binding EMAP/Myf-like protein